VFTDEVPEGIQLTTGGKQMKTMNVKRIAAAAAISGSLALGAIGLAGAASADNGALPHAPGNVGQLAPGQSLFPQIGTLDVIHGVNAARDIASFPFRVLGLPAN
jgi:hypothetical protein